MHMHNPDSELINFNINYVRLDKYSQYLTCYIRVSVMRSMFALSLINGTVAGTQESCLQDYLENCNTLTLL